MTLFVLHSTFTLLLGWQSLPFGHLSSFFERYLEKNAKAGREKKSWVKMVGGKIYILSWPLARLWISSTVD